MSCDKISNIFSVNTQARLKNALDSIVSVIFIIAHPIIGLLGALAMLFKALYHGLALNYHWRHSAERNEKGQLMPGTEYNIQNPTSLTKKDLSRLQHEEKRIIHEYAAKESLKFAADLGKCIIPIIGLIWMFTAPHTQLKPQNKSNLTTVQNHIKKLQENTY